MNNSKYKIQYRKSKMSNQSQLIERVRRFLRDFCNSNNEDASTWISTTDVYNNFERWHTNTYGSSSGIYQRGNGLNISTILTELKFNPKRKSVNGFHGIDIPSPLVEFKFP